MLLMGKSTISTGPFSSWQTVCLPEGNCVQIPRNDKAAITPPKQKGATHSHATSRTRSKTKKPQQRGPNCRLEFFLLYMMHHRTILISNMVGKSPHCHGKIIHEGQF